METVIDIDGQILTKITYTFGTIKYLNANGHRHRIGGPAIIGPKGTQFYFRYDKRHRIDGPAVIRSNGTKEYWVEGIEYPQEQYPKAVLAYKLKQTVG